MELDVAECLTLYYNSSRKKVYNFYQIYSDKQGYKNGEESHFILIEHMLRKKLSSRGLKLVHILNVFRHVEL